MLLDIILLAAGIYVGVTAFLLLFLFANALLVTAINDQDEARLSFALMPKTFAWPVKFVRLIIKTFSYARKPTDA